MRSLLALCLALGLVECSSVWQDEDIIEPTLCNEDSCRCDAFSRIICDCLNDYDEVTIRPGGPYRILSTATAIQINNCARVYFFPYAINGTIQMRSIELKNIRHVEFKENSMIWSPYSREYELSNPGLRIIVENCTVDNIDSYAFRGRLNNIVIKDTRLSSIRPYAFSSLSGVNNVELTNNNFSNIDIYAFKKFSMNNFILRGGNAHHFPSRFLSDVEVVENFRMDGVRVKEIYSNAFIVSGPKRVNIENNAFGILQGDAFKITTRGPTTFRNNTVGEINQGAFLGISVARNTISNFGLQDLLIDNNTVTSAQIESFHHNGSSVKLRIDGLNLAQPCECNTSAVWLEIISAQGGTIACNYTLEGHFISLPTYVDIRCRHFKEYFWVILGSVAFISLFVGGIVVFFVVWRERKKKKRLKVVMPDGKTYRETELHVIIEKAELLTTDL